MSYFSPDVVAYPQISGEATVGSGGAGLSAYYYYRRRLFSPPEQIAKPTVELSLEERLHQLKEKFWLSKIKKVKEE